MNIIKLSLKNGFMLYYKPDGHLFVQVGTNKMEGRLLVVFYGNL